MAAALLLMVGAMTQCAQAAPLIARGEMMTVDEIRPGMKGVGKSVFAGTRIESFGVTVIGVMRRVDFGGDIILVTIDSGPPVSKGFGVVSGMSGSPVYIRGKLIGALAYTWPFSKRPVAGVTPIAQMLEAFQPGSSPVKREGTVKATQPFVIDGQRIDRATIGTAALASAKPGAMALVPVSTPVMVSGLNPGSLSMLKTALGPMGLTPVSGAGAMAHVDAHLVPGAAVGARLMGGDLDITAVGTVTYVKDGVVLAFGHTMSSLGSADIPLVATYVHGIMPSSELSFKLASGGQALGRFTEDRPWCIGGRLGTPAQLVQTTVHVLDLDRKVTRDYGLQVIRNRSLTSLLLTAAMVGAIQSVGPPSEGTTRVSFSLDAEGLPRLARQNTYAVEEGGGLLALLLGPSAAVASATEELNQILDALQNSEFGEAKLSRLGISVEMSKRRRVARLERVLVDKHRVKPGDEVQVTATLRAANAGRIACVEKIRIPSNCPPGRVQVGIAGGRSAEWLRSRLEVGEPRPESLAQMLKQMLDRPSNDQLVVQVALPTVGVEARGLELHDLPPAVMDVLRSSGGTKLRPLRDYVERRVRTEWMVSGYSVASVIVEGDEKDKGGRPPSPQYGGSMFEEMPPGLMGLFSGFGLSARATAGGLVGIDEGDESFSEEEVPMPSWEEVSSVGETELTTPSGAGEPSAGAPPRGEAIGRMASVWRLSTAKDLAQGKPEGVAILSSGGLVLAPKPTVLGQVSAQCLWALAVAPDGSIYAGAWSDGKLWRIAPDGRQTVALETNDAAVQAVTVSKDGTVYAAAMPSGSIYRISPSAKPLLVCKVSAPAVWALAATESGMLWAATGPDGKLFRISPDGAASVAFTAADRHIVAIAAGTDGTLYLATSPKGKVYAISPDGAPRSVFEIEKSSAQSIAVDAAGNVYVGTSPDGRVLQIDKTGAVREVLKTKGKHVLALRVGADGIVYATAGPEASVYGIWPDQAWAELYDAKSAFLPGMANDGSGAIYLTAADTGQVIKLDSAASRAGRYTSPVRDAGATARWGAVRCQTSKADGSSVSISTRSGDTGHPDATWSDWQLVPIGSTGSVQSPPHRFLQCRVDVESGSQAAPRVESMEFSYLPANRPPEVTLSAPKGGEVWSGKKTVRWSGRDPDSDKLTYDAFWSADSGKTWTKIEAPVKTEAAPTEKAKEAPAGKGTKTPAVKPKAAAAPPSSPSSVKAGGDGKKPISGWQPAEESNPADERAKAGVRIKRDEAAPSDERGEEQTEKSSSAQQPVGLVGSPPMVTTSMDWDTPKVADRVYLIKVVGSDRLANPTDPRQDEAISRPFTIDNTPPDLIVDRGRKDSDQPPSEVSVFDRATYVTSAEFRIDSGPWLAAVAKDGIFDEPTESVLLDKDRVPTGSHQIEVRARDAAGNVANATLRYRQ
jgi:sugar lactone lactonase YvrE